MKKFKEDENGQYEWVPAGEGSGYWRKLEDPDITQYRTPEKCPGCGLGMDLWSIQNFYHRNGVCADCSHFYLEGRNWPEGHFKTRNDKVDYVKQKIAEKRARQ